MKTKYEKILSYYEELKLHKAKLSGKEGFFAYQSPSSLHSEVTSFAYGIRETRNCLSLKNTFCISTVVLDEKDVSRRFYIKLKACLFDWHKYVCGIKITINGKLAYENSREFFENVNLGWPTVYIPIKSILLKSGENIIKICQTGGETALLVSDADLLSLPAAAEGQQLTMKTAVRIGDEFALSFYSKEGDVSVSNETNCSVTALLRSPLNPEHIVAGIKAYGENPELTLNINGEAVCAAMPEVFPASTDYCMVGIDSDDHRHDNTDEADRIIEIFANTNMGNFWQARPQEYRNYYELSSQEVWKNRIDYLKVFNTKMSLSDGENVMPYFAKLCGENFLGKHFHEAYLYFCSALVYDEKLSKELFLDTDALKKSESFGDAKKLFCDALRKMYIGCKSEKGLTSVGSPSLLINYEVGSGFERVTIEPVSNINLLIAAVRGAVPEMWGAHVPTDWYFGEPNDITKAKKFLLAMKLLYMQGADYIYAENSIFKTNAFSREDWDDEFCSRCRSYLREFYEYTVKNPREGMLKTNLAVIYGNNEYFLWHYDDRIAELPENDDWDITVWGKWKDNRHHKCWRSIDAWLPLAENQNSKENILNLKLFSGTPYGNVDVIPYKSDYDKYIALVLLGWNTYESGFAKKIYDYVQNGGIAFLNYCHFNKTDRCDLPMEYADDEIEKYFGISCGEVITAKLSSEISVLKCTVSGAEKVAFDENGNALVWKIKIGKGIFYFGTFADYNCPEARLSVMQSVLKMIGEISADVICTNPNISFTERVLGNASRIDVLNMCSNGSKSEKYELLFKSGRKISGELMPCELKTIKI